jgi:hypothetical protein
MIRKKSKYHVLENRMNLINLPLYMQCDLLVILLVCGFLTRIEKHQIICLILMILYRDTYQHKRETADSNPVQCLGVLSSPAICCFPLASTSKTSIR